MVLQVVKHPAVSQMSLEAAVMGETKAKSRFPYANYPAAREVHAGGPLLVHSSRLEYCHPEISSRSAAWATLRRQV